MQKQRVFVAHKSGHFSRIARPGGKNSEYTPKKKNTLLKFGVQKKDTFWEFL